MKIRSIGSLSKGVNHSSATSTYLRPSAVNGAASRFNPSLSQRQLSSQRLTSTRPSPAIPNRAARQPLPIGTRNASTEATKTKKDPLADLKRTQLYDFHVAHKWKPCPYAGYAMPLYYADLSHLESHKWTREKASLFDVSHMVQHHLRGPGASDLLMKITPSSPKALKDNHSSLSCLLEEGTGGIVDDTVITRLGPESFYFVTNAGRRKEDLEFLSREIEAFKKTHGDAHINWEVLDTRALLALQGPSSAAVLQSLIHTTGEPSVDTDLSTLHFGQCRSLHLNQPDGSPTASRLLVSRTGYTGEDGFEISIPTQQDSNLPTQVAELLLSNSEVRLAGLAARDSLRLEAGMCLYGHELSTDITPPTAGLGWIVGKERRDASSPTSSFNGSSIILPQLASPAKTLKQRRVGLTIESGAPAREGSKIVDLANNNAEIGVVTSGLPSPSLGGTNIAMGYVKQGFHKKGTEVGVAVRKTVRKASVVGMPWVESKFYRG
ncbi:Aminomethyltransferase, mitochondrial [Arachnomyces sp. PD_36]|nr:Aminomethyltransferase, mitochondrial [Arachnomyces sp. PD_36]